MICYVSWYLLFSNEHCLCLRFNSLVWSTYYYLHAYFPIHTLLMIGLSYLFSNDVFYGALVFWCDAWRSIPAVKNLYKLVGISCIWYNPSLICRSFDIENWRDKLYMTSLFCRCCDIITVCMREISLIVLQVAVVILT